MSAGVKYGFVLGVLFVLLGQVAPQPAGSVVLWTALSVDAGVSAWIIWRRLPLPWFRVGMIAALLVSLIMIPISARGLNLATIATELPLPAVIAIWLGALWVPLSIGLESLRDSPEWRAWKAHQEHAGLWDVITFRHVPDMRSAKLQHDRT